MTNFQEGACEMPEDAKSNAKDSECHHKLILPFSVSVILLEVYSSRKIGLLHEDAVKKPCQNLQLCLRVFGKVFVCNWKMDVSSMCPRCHQMKLGAKELLEKLRLLGGSIQSRDTKLGLIHAILDDAQQA